MPVFESSFGPVAFVTVGIAFVFGKSSMVASSRATVPTDAYRDILTIGSNRTVSRMLVECGGQLVWVVNIHLHSPIDAAECRLEQMKQVLAWMGPVRQRGVGCIMMGDFNAGPAEPCYKLLTDLGWKSTHKLAHGQEPAVTFPGDGAGLMASTKDCDPAGTFGKVWDRESQSPRCGKHAPPRTLPAHTRRLPPRQTTYGWQATWNSRQGARVRASCSRRSSAATTPPCTFRTTTASTPTSASARVPPPKRRTQPLSRSSEGGDG